MLNELHTTLDGRVRLSRRSEQGALGPARQHTLCASKQRERRLAPARDVVVVTRGVERGEGVPTARSVRVLGDAEARG